MCDLRINVNVTTTKSRYGSPPTSRFHFLWYSDFFVKSLPFWLNLNWLFDLWYTIFKKILIFFWFWRQKKWALPTIFVLWQNSDQTIGELIYTCKIRFLAGLNLQVWIKPDIFSRLSQPEHFSRFKPDHVLLNRARFSGDNLLL